MLDVYMHNSLDVLMNFCCVKTMNQLYRIVWFLFSFFHIFKNDWERAYVSTTNEIRPLLIIDKTHPAPSNLNDMDEEEGDFPQMPLK
jgi:hypothetical protein